jgi:hypothetical protein
MAMKLNPRGIDQTVHHQQGQEKKGDQVVLGCQALKIDSPIRGRGTGVEGGLYNAGVAVSQPVAATMETMT